MVLMAGVLRYAVLDLALCCPGGNGFRRPGRWRLKTWAPPPAAHAVGRQLATRGFEIGRALSVVSDESLVHHKARRDGSGLVGSSMMDVPIQSEQHRGRRGEAWWLADLPHGPW